MGVNRIRSHLAGQTWIEVICVNKRLIALGITAVIVLSLVGCSTEQNTSQVKNNTTKQMTVKIDSSLAMLQDNYFQANATIDKFLNDWLTLDGKDGIALLNSKAKQGKSAAQLEHYFTFVPPGHESYEVVGYRKVSNNEYQFYVWMYGTAMGLYGSNGRPRTNPEFITVIKQNNKWSINNLPNF